MAELIRLCRYVESLERSVSLLAGRIEPYEGERLNSERDWIKHIGNPAPAATLRNLLILLRQADSRFECLEADFNALRAKVDQISNDAWSRDEMKPYLDKDRRRPDKA